MSLIVGGRRVEVPGVNVVSWLDDPKRAPLVTDGKARTVAPTCVVLHTSRGRRGKLQPGARPSNRAELLALYQARTKRSVSWHLTLDTDGDVLQQADVSTWMCWHCEQVNGWSVGLEAVQHPDTGDQWEAQIAAEVAVVETLCHELAIPRRVFVGADGAPWMKPVPALVMKKYGGPGGRFAGVAGHCNFVPDTVRGPGDPGDAIMAALLQVGFEGVEVGTLTTTRSS